MSGLTGLTSLRSLGGFVLRRTVGVVITLFAISVIVYVVFYVTPGNVAQITCGPRCSPAQVQQVAEQLHLNDPLYTRYWHFLEGLVAGQDYSTGASVQHCSAPCLGLSYQSDQQVTQLILAKLPVSLSLVFGAMVLWLILGVGTGVLSAWRRGRLTERLLTGVTLAGVATPVFVIGLVLMIVVCGQLQLLPFPQYVAFTDDPEQWAWNLLLPWLSWPSSRPPRSPVSRARPCWRRWPRTTSAPSGRTASASGRSSDGTRCAGPSRRSSR